MGPKTVYYVYIVVHYSSGNVLTIKQLSDIQDKNALEISVKDLEQLSKINIIHVSENLMDGRGVNANLKNGVDYVQFYIQAETE